MKSAIDNVHVANPEALNRKIKKFKQSGVDSFHVVADFDKTLTKAFVNGKNVLSSYALIRDGKYLTPDYSKRAHALFDKYHHFEIDPDLSLEEKKKKMILWWREHYELMVECGMSKSVIKDIISKRQLQLRDGAFKFLDLLHDQKIPLLIFSAGIGDLIKEFLEFEKKLYSSTHIISNFWTFDDKGVVTGCLDRFIHVFNKNEYAVKNTTYYPQIRHRKNVMLLGDSLGDLGMTEGIEHEGIIRVGFLNDNQEKFLDTYAKSFDIVVLDDGDMNYVNKVLMKILS